MRSSSAAPSCGYRSTAKNKAGATPALIFSKSQTSLTAPLAPIPENTPQQTPRGIFAYGSQSLNLLVVFCRSVASVASDCEAEAISSLEADCDSDEEEMFCMFSAVAWLIS